MVEGRPDRGVFIGGVLELDHRQRQAVDEDDHIRAAVDLAVLVRSLDRVLVDYQPVVVFWILEIHHPGAPADQAPVLGFVFHLDAVHQQAMKGMVVEQQRGLVGAGELAEGFVQRLLRQGRVDARAARPAGGRSG